MHLPPPYFMLYSIFFAILHISKRKKLTFSCLNQNFIVSLQSILRFARLSPYNIRLDKY